MFHGTNIANIDSILNTNLRSDLQPVDRRKGAAYGDGIYFSEFPCVGVSYGTLIVCRVLAGRVQVQLFCHIFSIYETDFNRSTTRFFLSHSCQTPVLPITNATNLLLKIEHINQYNRPVIPNWGAAAH